MNAQTVNFSAAGPTELIVYGSRKPEDTPGDVLSWVKFMRRQGITRVCCLLDAMQLRGYRPTLESQYMKHFGGANVCMAPITDYHLAERSVLHGRIIPFLRESETMKQRVVVHCWSGNGRTGHVLAAWLVAAGGLEPMEAIRTVEATGRKPREAVTHENATLEELLDLLRSCAADRPA